jgi:thiosulfate/3-mercaptopyruvate sulfurtransferase
MALLLQLCSRWQYNRLVLAALLLTLAPPASLRAEYRYVPAASIPATYLVQPADLAASLQAGSRDRPLILQVGAHVLFVQSHIPGSEYVGPGEESSGLETLRDRVAKLPRETPIVIYCGCCPWSHCRNIAGAYEQLRRLGFTGVKVLYLEYDFGSNWVDRGYPVAEGE